MHLGFIGWDTHVHLQLCQHYRQKRPKSSYENEAEEEAEESEASEEEEGGDEEESYFFAVVSSIESSDFSSV